jgi:hypothetical protein
VAQILAARDPKGGVGDRMTEPAVLWDADEAITQLYAAHYRPLVRLAALLLRDVALAEEVVTPSSPCTVPGGGCGTRSEPSPTCAKRW